MTRTRNYLLVILWITIIVSLVAQNVTPQIVSIDQLSIVGSDVYDFIIINNAAYLRIGGQPNQVAKINLITKQTEWSVNMNSPYNTGDELVKTPDDNLCYVDGGLIVKLSTQRDTLWVCDLSNYGNFSLSASSSEFLTCYSISSHLVLLDYTSGQIINHWQIITGGASGCGYHNAYAAADSTFYLFDNMPMGLEWNTGIKLTKVKIINGMAETIWFLQVDDLSNINGLADGNNIYFTARQVRPWNNGLIYEVADQGTNYLVESIVDIAGPDSTGFTGPSIAVDDNHQLILPIAIRLGDDPNGEDGYNGAIMAYHQGNLVWRINQSTMPFCRPLAVAVDSTKIYSISCCHQTYGGPLTFWLTELSTTVANDDPTTPTIPEPELFCYPNPFQGSTTIKFSQIDNSPTTVSIYNIKGQLICTLINNQKLSPGEHSFVWDGKNDEGHPVVAGIYFYKMTSGDFSSIKKMIMLK